MKKNRRHHSRRPSAWLLPCAALLLLLAACTDRLADDAQPAGTTPSAADRTPAAAFTVSLRLQTPADPAAVLTRVPANDGAASEYAVNNGLVAFFTCPSDAADPQASAVLRKVYNLTDGLRDYDLADPANHADPAFSPFKKDTQSTQISSYAYYKKELSYEDLGLANSSAEAIYALVLLNCSELFTIPSGTTGLTTLTPNPAYIDATGYPTSGDVHLSDILSLRLTSAYYAQLDADGKHPTDGYFMASAPASTHAGRTENPQANLNNVVSPLVLVTPLVLAGQDAFDKDANVVCVERAVAKLSVTWGRFYPDSIGIVCNTTTSKAKVVASSVAWAVDRYNTQSYVVRHFTPAWQNYKANSLYRFIDNVDIGLNAFRTLWAQDVNPSALDAAAVVLGNDDFDAAKRGSGDVAYIFENTVDAAADMTAGNLTRIVVRIQLTDPSGVLPQSGDVFYGLIGTDGKQALCSNLEYVKTYLADVLSQSKHTTYTAAQLFSATPVALSGSSLVVSPLPEASLPAGVTAAELSALVSNFAEVRTYPQGIMYYAAYIRHFDDNETPWTAGDAYDNERHLGRYGVVRNHWYRLALTRFDRLGYPSVADLPASGAVDALP